MDTNPGGCIITFQNMTIYLLSLNCSFSDIIPRIPKPLKEMDLTSPIEEAVRLTMASRYGKTLTSSASSKRYQLCH